VTRGPSDDDDEDDESASDSAPAGASSEAGAGDRTAAPTGTPPGTPPTKLSRRQQAAEESRQRIQQLEAERDQAREQGRAEAREALAREQAERQAQEQQASVSRAHLADVERLQRLLRTPDGQLTAEDYAWREDQKELLARYPDAERHFAAERDHAITVERQRQAAERTAFLDGIVAQLRASEALPGVSHDDLKADAPTPLDSWDKMAAYFHAAGASSTASELQPKLDQALETIERQAAEIKDLRLVGPRGLGAARAPVSGGTSAGTENGSSSFDPRRSARDNLAAALAQGSNGH
jgi:hypothetical protein